MLSPSGVQSSVENRTLNRASSHQAAFTRSYLFIVPLHSPTPLARRKVLKGPIYLLLKYATHWVFKSNLWLEAPDEEGTMT